MDRFHREYVKIKIVGKGSFGEAILCTRLQTSEQVVVKRIKIKMDKKEEQQALNEVKILSRLRHPNIVQYIDSWVENGILYIVMEYAEGGDLYAKLAQLRDAGMRIDETVVLDWFIQMCSALKHLHDQKILHRDLKTQNIFLTTGDSVVKLGDFGIARLLKDSMEQAHTVVGTPYYLSPEICGEKPYNNRSDIWSLGVILYEMLTLRHPFNATNLKDLMKKIKDGVYTYVEFTPNGKYVSTGMCDLVRCMLQLDAAARPSVSALFRTPICKNRLRAMVGPINKPARQSAQPQLPPPQPQAQLQLPQLPQPPSQHDDNIIPPTHTVPVEAPVVAAQPPPLPTPTTPPASYFAAVNVKEISRPPMISPTAPPSPHVPSQPLPLQSPAVVTDDFLVHQAAALQRNMELKEKLAAKQRDQIAEAERRNRELLKQLHRRRSSSPPIVPAVRSPSPPPLPIPQYSAVPTTEKPRLEFQLKGKDARIDLRPKQYNRASPSPPIVLRPRSPEPTVNCGARKVTAADPVAPHRSPNVSPTVSPRSVLAIDKHPQLHSPLAEKYRALMGRGYKDQREGPSPVNGKSPLAKAIHRDSVKVEVANAGRESPEVSADTPIVGTLVSVCGLNSGKRKERLISINGPIVSVGGVVVCDLNSTNAGGEGKLSRVPVWTPGVDLPPPTPAKPEPLIFSIAFETLKPEQMKEYSHVLQSLHATLQDLDDDSDGGSSLFESAIDDLASKMRELETPTDRSGAVWRPQSALPSPLVIERYMEDRENDALRHKIEMLTDQLQLELGDFFYTVYSLVRDGGDRIETVTNCRALIGGKMHLVHLVRELLSYEAQYTSQKCIN